MATAETCGMSSTEPFPAVVGAARPAQIQLEIQDMSSQEVGDKRQARQQEAIALNTAEELRQVSPSGATAMFGAILLQQIEDEDAADSVAPPERKRKWKPKFTPNIRALATSAVLFSIITVVQAFFAHIANSEALLADCVSMGVDSFTYVGNIIVECRKDAAGNPPMLLQLVIVAFSLVLLFVFNLVNFNVSKEIVQVCMGHMEHLDHLEENSEDAVNGWITLSFSLAGIMFDLICIHEFYRSNRKAKSAREVNMLSAILHVGSDLLRSASTMVMSLFILLSTWDSFCIDGYTSLIVEISIFGACFLGFFKLLKMLLSCIRRTFRRDESLMSDRG